MTSYLVVFEDQGLGDWYFRLLGVVAILDVLGTVTVAALVKFGPSDGRAAGRAGALALSPTSARRLEHAATDEGRTPVGARRPRRSSATWGGLTRLAGWRSTSASPRRSRSSGCGSRTSLRPRSSRSSRRSSGTGSPTRAGSTCRRGRSRPGCSPPRRPVALGGGGFRFDDAAVLLEEAGYSLLGPLALNCAAPDEGNIHLLHLTATPRAAGALPAAPGRRRGAVLLLHDRAAPGRRFRPFGAAHPGQARRGRLGPQRREVADHRRRRCRLLDRHGTERGRRRPRGRHDVPRRRRTTPGSSLGEHLNTIDGTFLGGHLRVSLRDCFVPDDGRPRRAGHAASRRPRCASHRRG